MREVGFWVPRSLVKDCRRYAAISTRSISFRGLTPTAKLFGRCAATIGWLLEAAIVMIPLANPRQSRGLAGVWEWHGYEVGSMRR